MPAFDFPDDPSDPLFPPEDPLEFNLIVGGVLHTFRCKDKGRLPDDSVVGLDNRPRSYLINSAVEQVIDDQQADAKHWIEEAFETADLDESKIGKLLEWLTAERTKAAKKMAQRRTGRPTTAPSASGT